MVSGLDPTCLRIHSLSAMRVSWLDVALLRAAVLRSNEQGIRLLMDLVFEGDSFPPLFPRSVVTMRKSRRRKMVGRERAPIEVLLLVVLEALHWNALEYATEGQGDDRCYLV